MMVKIWLNGYKKNKRWVRRIKDGYGDENK